MSEGMIPVGEFRLYTTEDGRSRVECRFQHETIWLTQKLMGELFQKDVRTINEHIQNILSEGELQANSVIRNFRITAADGKSYETQHYSLDAILAVGYRVRSERGTLFRQWATARLKEYLVKGFTMDDERLKNPPVAGSGEELPEFPPLSSRKIPDAISKIVLDLFQNALTIRVANRVNCEIESFDRHR